MKATSVALLFSAVACTSCSMLSSNPNPEPLAAPPHHEAAVQTPSTSPDTVTSVQSKLREFGYNIGKRVDGVFGRYTARALRNFQERNSLSPTGRIDGPTLQALKLTPNGTDAVPVNSDRDEPREQH